MALMQQSSQDCAVICALIMYLALPKQCSVAYPKRPCDRKGSSCHVRGWCSELPGHCEPARWPFSLTDPEGPWGLGGLAPHCSCAEVLKCKSSVCATVIMSFLDRAGALEGACCLPALAPPKGCLAWPACSCLISTGALSRIVQVEAGGWGCSQWL